MSDGTLLIVGLSFLLIVGLVSPVIISFFIDTSTISTDNSLMDPVIDFVEDGFNFFGFSINPFDLLFGLKDYILESFIVFSLLPDFIIAIFMILLFIAILYGFKAFTQV